ncbi:MAG: dihydropteroate synthase [Cytophagales bacterium]|nr:dihydropteroate synthase [Cytophagales bacterium]
MEKKSVSWVPQIRLRGNLIPLIKPQVVGILNITPDSFYDGGELLSEKNLLRRAEKYLKEGALMLDIGAYSSRPNAIHISEEEELKRVLPAIRSLIRSFPEAYLSIDTFRSRVAKEALDQGVCLVNDISAGEQDPLMIPLIAKRNTPYWIMHMRGTPQTMTSKIHYQDLVKEVYTYLYQRLQICRKAGISEVWVDPGFGFAKATKENYLLLRNLSLLRKLNCPIAIGVSRKSMIYKMLKITPKQALNGSTALHMVALQNGAKLLRVHDVKEAQEIIKLYLLSHESQT